MDLSVFGSPTDFQWGLANDPNFLNTAALYGISYQDILNYITPQVQQPTTLLTNQPDTSAQEAEAARIAAERAAEAAYYEEERRRLEAEEAARRAQEAALIEAERLAEIRRLEEAQAIYYPPVVEPTPEPVYNPVYYYASDGAAFLDQTQRNSYESNLQAIYVAQQQAAIAAQEAAARAAAEEQARIAAERAAAERAAQEAAARAAQEAAARAAQEAAAKAAQEAAAKAAQEAAARAAQEAATRAAQEAAAKAAQEAAAKAAQEAAAKAAADEAARQEALRVAEEQAKAAAAEAARIAKEQQEAKTAAEAAALAEQQRIAQEAAAKAAAELAAQQKAAEEAAAKVAAEEAAKLAAEKAAAEKAAAEQAALQNTEVSTQTGNQTMASRFTPEEEAAIVDYVVSNINNPTAIQQAAAQYGVTAQDLANVLGKPLETVQKYFLDAGVPQGTLLTGDVQRTFGTEGNITQLDKGEDFVVEKAIGMQGDKILVQAYDAYGLPTSTRLADPNTSEGKGWLQALGIVGGAIGLSNLATTGSLLGGTGTAVGGAGTAGLGGLSAETLATLEATGLSNIPGIVNTTGNLLNTGLLAGAAGTVVPTTTTPTTTTPTTTPTTTTPTTTTPTTTPTTTTPTTTTPTTTTPTTTTPTTTPTTTTPTTTPTSFNPTSLLPNIANTLLQGLTNASAASTLAGLVSSGANLAMVNDAAQKLRDQGKLSQTEYNTIATNLAGLYRDVGFEAKTGLQDVASKASGMIGKFTPYGVSNQLFGTKVSPTGQLETTMTQTGAELYAPFARVAGQSALAAENMNIETLASDYYKKLAALSAPETERQRLALEERMRQQGRLGILSSNIDPITGKARVSTAPELLAQEQAIARQQLERELQSRQAALGERGALITQGTTAYSPISNLLGLQSQQQQLSGQLGQAATQADVARASAYMQPATAAITAPLSLYGQGLQQVGQTQRLGTASNLASQQAALDALAVGRSNTANQLLGQGGSNLTSLFNTASSLFNQPSNYVPGTNITYADALNQGILPL